MFVPMLQSRLGVGVLFCKFVETFSSDDVHGGKPEYSMKIHERLAVESSQRRGWPTDSVTDSRMEVGFDRVSTSSTTCSTQRLRTGWACLLRDPLRSQRKALGRRMIYVKEEGCVLVAKLIFRKVG